MKELIMVSMLLGTCCFAATATTATAEEMTLELKASTTMREVLWENTGKRVALRR